MLYEKRTASAVVLVVTSLMNPVVYAADDDGNKDGWEAKIGLAYDSNIYRAPSDPYFDVPAGVTVTPNVQSGLFIPVRVKGKFNKASDAYNAFKGSLDFKHDKYIDSEYSNADKTKFSFEAGHEHVFTRKKSKERNFYIGFKYKKSIDSYLDRDTGDEKLVGTTDISDRYQYSQTGFKFAYKSRISKPQYNLIAEYYDRKYKDVVGVIEYDYTYYKLGGEAKFRLAKPTKLGLKYNYYVYDYKERSARDANTAVLNGNVLRQYAYNKFGADLRHRFSKNMLVKLDYELKLRTDQHEGYNDYTKNKLRAQLKYNIDKRQLVKLDMAYWKRDYPNAFAYDVAGQNQKKYQGTKTRVSYHYQWDKDLTIITQLDNWNENSSDSRYQFDRSIIWAGVEWKF